MKRELKTFFSTKMMMRCTGARPVKRAVLPVWRNGAGVHSSATLRCALSKQMCIPRTPIFSQRDASAHTVRKSGLFFHFFLDRHEGVC
jgi:hypothetical protein